LHCCFCVVGCRTCVCRRSSAVRRTT
jgi:hypothetical protein